jgi:hypothetical protein
MVWVSLPAASTCTLGSGWGAALVYMVLINEVVLGCQDLRVEGIKISASNYGSQAARQGVGKVR